MTKKYRLVQMTRTVTNTVLVEVDVYGENEENGDTDFDDAVYMLEDEYGVEFDTVKVTDLGVGTKSDAYDFIED